MDGELDIGAFAGSQSHRRQLATQTRSLIALSASKVFELIDQIIPSGSVDDGKERRPARSLEAQGNSLTT